MPMGSCRTTGRAFSLSTIMPTTLKKSAPTRSILLTKAIPGPCTCSPASRPSGLRLDAADRAEHGHCAVKHAERPFNLYCEIDMAGGIDYIYEVVFPRTGGCGGSDGDASFLLLLHPVHYGGAVMDLSYLISDTRVIEYPLRSGGLPGIYMGHDADVPQSCLMVLTLPTE